MLQNLFAYLLHSATLTLGQLLMLLGPALVLAYVLDWLSRGVRLRAARVLGVNGYTYLTAPGVMVHELGHAFFCVVFRHRILQMKLFSPQPDGQLGSVKHAWNPRSHYQKLGNFFIGTGPIWFGTAVICLLSWGLLGSAALEAASRIAGQDNRAGLLTMITNMADLVWPIFASLVQPSRWSTWQFWVFAYLIFCIGSHITLSRPDLDNAASGFVTLVVFVFLFNLLTMWIGPAFSIGVNRRLMQGFAFFWGASFLVVLLNLGLIAILAGLAALGIRVHSYSRR